MSFSPVLRTGRPPTEAQNPQPPKVLGRVLGEVPARNRVLVEMLGKVLVLLVPRRDTRGKHFSEHFPEHPVSGRHLSEHSPEHFLGFRGFCLASAKEHPKTQHTRKRRHLTVPRICVFGCVAFSGVFWGPFRGEQRAPENATHPKTQILGTVKYLRFRVCCVFGCSLFPSEKIALVWGAVLFATPVGKLAGELSFLSKESCFALCRAFFKGGERHSRDTRDDGTVTL